ncbi:membrane carboxypeptidase/penicillin-binding protein [Methylophaga aminisulfidivorans MP]|uniref:Penicillin-binding protein 1A n=1 Tax=Methylophaga aminisulfidivorans MP TaxID=1026882 RepID=F5SY13_9GAMM|nr:penicillin-binding protein 1A [Methylophaga aminisulfidivorans]EGL54081.1 membrane carboxypeptidase/penicillin-binding protein [Methylophaga aminisulfidivorans MP]
MYRFIRLTTKLILILALLTLIAAGVIYFFLAPKLPDTNTLKETQLQIPLRIFSSEGLLMAEFGEKRRIPVEYNDIPKPLVEAFLAAEDDRFYQHPGVDYQGIIRAAYSLLLTGEKSQGGSTITMQVARNFFLSNEKTYLRKLNEIILALEIEKVLSKEEILALYLNKIYLGSRAYGVGAAANVYYGKPLDQLSLAEMAMIAGLPKAPSAYNPIANPERATVRRNYVLRRMWEVGFIQKADYEEAIKAPVTASYHGPEIKVYAPYVSEMVRTELINKFGEEAYTNGFNVYTTIRAKHQQAANKALQSALLDYDRRHGYRGPVANVALPEDVSDRVALDKVVKDYDNIGPLKTAVVIETTDEKAELYIRNWGYAQLPLNAVKWAQKKLSTNSRGPVPKKITDAIKVGDIIRVEQLTSPNWELAELPEAQGALIAVAPYDGAVTALNGGFDFFNNKFNRVTQSRRQPGSGFKPFIYSAALEKGYTAATIINDAPVVFDDPGLENVWRPQNYSGKFFGPTRLREALIHSRNLVSIRLLRDIGADYAVEYAERFGFKPGMMHKNLSLALGSGSAAPWDMARAYSSLANGGYKVEPYIIQRVEDASGKIVMQATPDTVCETCLMDESTLDESDFHVAKRIMTPQNNYIMNSLLRDVVKHGTGRKAMSLGRDDLAGKTGTTNDQVDAWFNGFHPELVAVAWVGFDNPHSLGRYETGGRAALPMWIDFMKVALEGMPEAPLQPPVGMVTVRIDPATGLLARPEATDAIYETFREEYVPKQMAPLSGQGDSGTSPAIDLF